MSTPNYNLDDLKKLLEIIEDILRKVNENVKVNESLIGVRAALTVIIKKNISEHVKHAKKYICINDSMYTDPGFNTMLFDMPLEQLLLQSSNLLAKAGYLGKAIIVWRGEIKK